MKKALSFIIAVVMFMQMFVFSVSAANFSVNWDNGHNGTIEFTRPSKDKIEYTIGIYKDSMYVQGYNVSFSGKYLDTSYYLGPEIEKAGNGSYETVVSYTDANGNLITAKTPSYNYKKPTAKMQKATGVKFNKSTGVATWKAVPDAYYYEVELMYKDPYEGYYYAPVYGNAYESTSYDFNEYGELDMFYEDLEWTAEEYGISANEIETAVRVIAYCEDIETKSSSVSDYYSFSGTVLETNPNATETISEYYWSSRGTVRTPTFKTVENNYYYIVELFKDDESLEKIPKYDWTPGMFSVSADEAKFIMADNGEGSYQFTITDSNGNKVTSKKYDYVPGKPLTAPYNLSSNGNIFSWECDDQEVSNYEIELFLTYKDSDYYERVYHDKVYRGTQYEINKWKLEEYNNAVVYNHEKDSVNKNKENARLAFRVYSMPKSSTYTPGASNYLVDGKEIEVNKPQKKPLVQVDRSSITDIKYVESAKIVYDLGLMENIYENPSATITKGEFCEIAVKMLGAEDVAKGMKDSSSIFSDVTTGTDLNGYVIYLYNKGIINGDGTGAFGVATEFTYAEIVRTLVVMVGYKEYAQSMGGSNSAYFTAANKAKITAGVSLKNAAPVTREQMGRLVANTIEAKILEKTGYTMSGPIYEETDKTLLFEYMGYVRILGTGYATGNEISIEKNILFSKDYPKGIASADVEIENTDYDAMELNGKRTMFYVKDSKNVCSIQYYGGQVVINNGDAETSNRNVTFTINADGYTKYRFLDGTTYFPITSPISYRLSASDGIQYVNIVLANDDESRTHNISDSIIFNNKRTIKYMVNGKLFATQTVGCEKSIPALAENPSVTGYRFDGWDPQMPSYMPDENLVVNARMTPITTVTGKVTKNGEPVSGAEIWEGGRYYGRTDANGNINLDFDRGEYMLVVRYGKMSETIYCNMNEATLDLGTIELEPVSTDIMVYNQNVTSVAGTETIFTEEDKAFAETEGNVVSVKVEVNDAYSNANISAKESETDYKVESLIKIDIKKVKSGEENSQEIITETNNLLEFKFVIPENGKGKSSYVVLREHNGEVDMLTTAPNEDGEYIVINQDEIVIYAKKFSTYGLAAKEVVSATKTDSGVSFEINLNEQVVKESALMIVKAYNKRGVQLASKTISVPSAYSREVFLECKDATGYKLMFWGGFDKINPYYAVIDGSL